MVLLALIVLSAGVSTLNVCKISLLLELSQVTLVGKRECMVGLKLIVCGLGELVCDRTFKATTGKELNSRVKSWIENKVIVLC